MIIPTYVICLMLLILISVYLLIIFQVITLRFFCTISFIFFYLAIKISINIYNLEDETIFYVFDKITLCHPIDLDYKLQYF